MQTGFEVLHDGWGQCILKHTWCSSQALSRATLDHRETANRRRRVVGMLHPPLMVALLQVERTGCPAVMRCCPDGVPTSVPLVQRVQQGYLIKKRAEKQG